MGKPHLSRHFLASRASCLALINFAAAGKSDEIGIATTHNLLAFTGWNEDAQVGFRAHPPFNRSNILFSHTV
jgi:hypothetical protein